MIAIPVHIFQNTLIGASLAALVCSLIGVFVVRMNLSSMGFCMSHAAFAGAALGLAISKDPLIMALGMSTLVALILGPIAERAKLQADIILGTMFSLTMALGLFFLSIVPGSAMSSTALSILWGSVLGITDADLIRLGALAAFLIVALALFQKEFLAIMLDRKLAEESGINTRPFYYAILFLCGVTVSFSLKLVGGLLIFALMVNPVSSAYQYSSNMRNIIVLAPIFGLLSSVFGILLSLQWDLPLGSSIVIVSVAIFLISVAISPKRRRG
jgi:zinc/manganese transport system permease protein